MKYIFLLALIGLTGFFIGQRSPEKKIDFLSAKLANGGNTMFKSGVKNGSWKTFVGIAEDDQPALVRSVIARIGLGANTNEEAIYLNAREDINGDPLVSNRNYQITVPAEIPVHEFWSITVYGNNHFLCNNPANKFAISSFHKLSKNPDGTITLYLGQHEMQPVSNWLPSSIIDEPISLTLRCYHPTASMLRDIESINLPTIKPIK